MKLLAIETSSPILGAAVCIEAGAIAISEAPEERASVNLIARIERLLKSKRIPLSDIDGYAVSIGPGSFTGLRVGVTAVKGLSYVTKKPIVSVATLDVIARNVAHIDPRGLYGAPYRPLGSIWVCVIVDARKGNVYSAIYRCENGAVKKRSPYLLEPVEKVLKRLKGPVIFVGDGIGTYRDTIEKKYKRAIFTDRGLWYPHASVVGELGIRKFKQKKFSDCMRLVPMYMYGRECNVIKRKP